MSKAVAPGSRFELRTLCRLAGTKSSDRLGEWDRVEGCRAGSRSRLRCEVVTALVVRRGVSSGREPLGPRGSSNRGQELHPIACSPHPRLEQQRENMPQWSRASSILLVVARAFGSTQFPLELRCAAYQGP